MKIVKLQEITLADCPNIIKNNKCGVRFGVENTSLCFSKLCTDEFPKRA